ncbi:MAG: type II toxin-antitoxin system VapC family toxin [Lysobacterales bacterium]
MRILLDTNIVLWAMGGSVKLSKAARREIEQADTVYVSAASLWEIGIKVGLDKLDVDIDQLVSLLAEAGFVQLPISWKHAQMIQGLPHHHRDPFDRMLVAQAISEPLRLVTHDALLTRYSDLVLVV